MQTQSRSYGNYLLYALMFLTILMMVSWFSEPAKAADPAPVLFCRKSNEPLPANAFVELARAINPAVVNISTTTTPRQMRSRGQQMPRDPFFEMFEQFNGGPFQQREVEPQQALGTGFIIRKDGLILTNNHVIEGADVIQVQLTEGDKQPYTAKVIGRDGRTDIALIKIDPKRELTVAKFGSSKTLPVGEWVAAFGNPYGHGHSMSKGIVSAIGRSINEINRFPFIQTDASINPGNSGGPLVNMCGEVVGVNAAIDARAQGIGFAIPIDDVKAILPSLEKEGSIKRAFLGAQFYPQPLDPRARAELKIPVEDGALIVGILENTPAQRAGLKAYDFVTKFGTTEIEDGESFRRAIEDSTVGTSYPIEFYRDGKKRTAQVTLKSNDTIAQPSPGENKPSFQNPKSAPHGLGFKVSTLSPEKAATMGLMLNRAAPVITEVDPKSPSGRAGLRPGDIVIDVNRQPSANDAAVIKNLKGGQVNSMRVLRGQLPILIYMEAK